EEDVEREDEAERDVGADLEPERDAELHEDLSWGGRFLERLSRAVSAGPMCRGRGRGSEIGARDDDRDEVGYSPSHSHPRGADALGCSPRAALPRRGCRGQAVVVRWWWTARDLVVRGVQSGPGG